MQLQDGFKLDLMCLGATEENHLRQLRKESARKDHTVFFPRSGHLKTSMTEHDFFFLNQDFHD